MANSFTPARLSQRASPVSRDPANPIPPASTDRRAAALAVTMFNSANLTEWLKYSVRGSQPSHPPARVLTPRACRAQWLASVGSAVQMIGDLTISATLIYVLRTSRTGISK